MSSTKETEELDGKNSEFIEIAKQFNEAMDRQPWSSDGKKCADLYFELMAEKSKIIEHFYRKNSGTLLNRALLNEKDRIIVELKNRIKELENK